MTQNKKTKEELQDTFENFLSKIDDYMNEFIEKLADGGYVLDYSMESLDVLEKYLSEKKVTASDDDYNDSATYVGEVIIKNYGGQWICSLDEKENSLYYGFPVIVEHTKFNVQFSPFHSVKVFILRPRNNHFKIAILGQINPKSIDLSHLPSED